MHTKYANEKFFHTQYIVYKIFKKDTFAQKIE